MQTIGKSSTDIHKANTCNSGEETVLPVDAMVDVKRVHKSLAGALGLGSSVLGSFHFPRGSISIRHAVSVPCCPWYQPVQPVS